MPAVLALFIAGQAAAQAPSVPRKSCTAPVTAECLFEQALAHDDSLLQIVVEAISFGNHAQARLALERLRDYAKAREPRVIVFVQIILAHNYGRIGDLEAARRELKAAAALVLAEVGVNPSTETLTEIATRQQNLYASLDVRETAEAIARHADSIQDPVTRGKVLATVAALKVYAGDPEAAAGLEDLRHRASVLAYAAAVHAGRSPMAMAERLLADAARAAREWIASGQYGYGEPSAVLLNLALAKGRLGDKLGALAEFRRALSEQDRAKESTPRYVNRVPIALAMIEEGAIAEALASANVLDGSELALVHRAAARAYLRRGQFDEARQAAARASVADRVAILVEIAAVADKQSVSAILSEARMAAEASQIAAALLAQVAQAHAKQGWHGLVRENAKRYVAEAQAMKDAYERGEALKNWLRAQIKARDPEGARITAEAALRVAEAAGDARSLRPETMAHESEKEISLRAAAESFALIGDLQAAHDAANLIANPSTRALALASASRHAVQGAEIGR